MPTILIADDHPLFRTALRAATASVFPDAYIAEASDLSGTLAHLHAEETDLVLLDLHMPDSGGLTGVVALRAQFPGVIVLVVSAQEDAAVVRRALDFGAAGFVAKSASPEEIADAIRSVFQCGSWIPAQLADEVEQMRSNPGDLAVARRMAHLTSQQFRVLSLIAQGRLNKQIADELGVQLSTIKAHVSAIFDKLEVRNRTQACMLMRDLDISTQSERFFADAGVSGWSASV